MCHFGTLKEVLFLWHLKRFSCCDIKRSFHSVTFKAKWFSFLSIKWFSFCVIENWRRKNCHFVTLKKVWCYDIKEGFHVVKLREVFIVWHSKKNGFHFVSLNIERSCHYVKLTEILILWHLKRFSLCDIKGRVVFILIH